MEKSGINLFGDNNTDEMQMPTAKYETEGNELKTDDVDKALFGETVKTLLLPEKQTMELPNYVLDFSKNMNMNTFQKLALDSLLDKNGDVSIYLYSSKNIVKVGMGDRLKLERIINLYKGCILNEEVKVYKDVDIDKPIIEVKAKDITKLRMNI